GIADRRNRMDVQIDLLQWFVAPLRSSAAQREAQRRPSATNCCALLKILTKLSPILREIGLNPLAWLIPGIELVKLASRRAIGTIVDNQERTGKEQQG
ncbi:MAG TPA: hypothetical protein VFP95_07010, partial [Gammaproteobacteria bacterium]|nr:hypothetical protein [Gammaproteobacteria bacterium]